MLSIRGIYDKGQIQLLEKISSRKRSKVIVTFVDEPSNRAEEEKTRAFANNTDSFSFWDNDAENIYQNYLPKSKQ